MLLLAVTVVLFIKDKIEVGQSCCVVTSLVSFSSRSACDGMHVRPPCFLLLPSHSTLFSHPTLCPSSAVVSSRAFSLQVCAPVSQSARNTMSSLRNGRLWNNSTKLKTETNKKPIWPSSCLEYLIFNN